MAGEHEARPTRRLVTAREHELRIGELGAGGIDLVRMVFLELRDGVWIAAMDGAEQVLGLVLQLIQVRTNGKATIGYDEPPWELPGVRLRRAQRRFA